VPNSPEFPQCSTSVSLILSGFERYALEERVIYEFCEDGKIIAIPVEKCMIYCKSK
jgi:hypothetical protein